MSFLTILHILLFISIVCCFVDWAEKIENYLQNSILETHIADALTAAVTKEIDNEIVKELLKLAHSHDYLKRTGSMGPQ